MKKSFIPKLNNREFISKLSFELLDENDNVVYRLNRANAKKSKNLILDILRWKV